MTALVHDLCVIVDHIKNHFKSIETENRSTTVVREERISKNSKKKSRESLMRHIFHGKKNVEEEEEEAKDEEEDTFRFENLYSTPALSMNENHSFNQRISMSFGSLCCVPFLFHR